ncbi:MAG: hypothetical protein IJE50_05470 [Clostridia bacterium]|nr:hypothetical protein [Clostridia bacterium]MBQ3041763.1 hypothetical protein [Clostridia bacterium]
MMTKKTMTILSVFMIVALTAVGFAAWLIVGTIDAETQGSFVSNELKDKYFKVEVNFDNDGEVDEEKGDIIFGRPTTDYVYSNGSWLSYSNRDAKQKLSATATVKFIPDDGFLVDNDDNTENRDMKYYLEKIVSENLTNPENDVKEYRTVRVVIDINEVISEATKNYKWFDMAVELGYIQYPTAKWVAHTGAAKADTDLKWGKIENVDGEDVVKALTEAEVNAGVSFEENFLYIDLSYDMFDIHSSNEYATANIQIDFAWGEAVATGEGDDRVYNNPYTYFDELNPEGLATVLQYLDVETEELEATQENTQDEDKPGVEDYDLETAKYIRNKDLAQRMLDYLRDYLNYEADGDGNRTAGIQFSIVLSEGTAIPNA